MRKAVVMAVALAALAGGCAHGGIKKVSDCGDLPVERRLECSACVGRNEAQGWLGTWEFFPDERDSEHRCRRVK